MTANKTSWTQEVWWGLWSWILLFTGLLASFHPKFRVNLNPGRFQVAITNCPLLLLLKLCVLKTSGANKNLEWSHVDQSLYPGHRGMHTFHYATGLTPGQLRSLTRLMKRGSGVNSVDSKYLQQSHSWLYHNQHPPSIHPLTLVRLILLLKNQTTDVSSYYSMHSAHAFILGL